MENFWWGLIFFGQFISSLGGSTVTLEYVHLLKEALH